MPNVAFYEVLLGPLSQDYAARLAAANQYINKAPERLAEITERFRKLDEEIGKLTTEETTLTPKPQAPGPQSAALTEATRLASAGAFSGFAAQLLGGVGPMDRLLHVNENIERHTKRMAERMFDMMPVFVG